MLVRALVRLVLALTALVAALYLLLLGWGTLLRLKGVNDATRRMTKPANTLLRKIAGTRWGAVYFNMSALKHVGRSSGREYVTPLSAYPLLVRPFIWVNSTNRAVWLHRQPAVPGRVSATGTSQAVAQ